MLCGYEEIAVEPVDIDEGSRAELETSVLLLVAKGLLDIELFRDAVC